MIIAKKTIGTIAYMGGLPSNLQEFTWSWGRLLQFSQEYLCGIGERIEPGRSTVSEHAQARTNLSRNFLGDWLLMLDADHAFEPDIALRMVGLMLDENLDVLTATYTYRSEPYAPTLYDYDPEAMGFKMRSEVPRDVRFFPIDCAGAGTLLIRRKVFEQIERETKQGAFDVLHPYEEDFSFFERCRLLGIKCHATAQVQTHHLLVKPLSLDDYQSEGR